MARVQGEGAALSADEHVFFHIYVQAQYQMTRMPIFVMTMESPGTELKVPVLSQKSSVVPHLCL